MLSSLRPLVYLSSLTHLVTMVSRNEVELLLKTQRECYNDSMQCLMNSFNDRVGKLEKELYESKTEIALLRQENSSNETKISSLVDRICQLETSEHNLGNIQQPIFDRLDSLEDHSRRNNIRVDGLAEQNVNENWEQTAEAVRKLVKDNLGIAENITIERAHRVGRKSSEKPRTVIAKFLQFKDRDAILRNSNKLKGSNIFISEDLCESSRAKRREKLPALKQARRDGKIAYFSHTNLIIKDRPPETSNVAPASTSGQVSYPPRTAPSENAARTSGRATRSGD